MHSLPQSERSLPISLTHEEVLKSVEIKRSLATVTGDDENGAVYIQSDTYDDGKIFANNRIILLL